MGREFETGQSVSAILAFLRTAQRLILLRNLLVAMLVCAAANVAVGSLIRGLNRMLARELPLISVGLPLFLVLAGTGIARNRTRKVARRVDRRLGLQDRLTTFLDFAGRETLEPGFRRAQADETSAALARVNLRRGFPVRGFHWAGPPAFVWMLYMSYLAGSAPFEFREPALFSRTAAERGATEPGGNEPSGSASQQDGALAPSDSEVPPAAPPAAPPDAPPQRRAAASERSDEPAGPGANPSGGVDAARTPGNVGSSRAVFSEPATLYSEPVGTGLTPVAEGGPGSRGDLKPGIEQLLRGRISFNLVPADGSVGGPEGPGAGGGRAGSLEITVDYDAVPTQYRDQVRRYFERLARLYTGGRLGT